MYPRDMTEKDYKQFIRNPAIQDSPSGDVYFIKNDSIIGTGRISSFDGSCRYCVSVEDDRAKAFFANDPIVKVLGFRYCSFGFQKWDGLPMPVYADEEMDHLEGISVVSCFYFDLGFAHKRYSHIEGFGSKLLKKGE